jgi:hypothetical protein
MFHRFAIAGRKGGKAPQGRRQKLVDLGADHLGQHRPCPFGADRNRDGRTVDESRREEIAVVGLIDGVGRDLHGAGGIDDAAILLGVTGCGKDQNGTLDLFGSENFANGFNAVGDQKSVVIGLRAIGMRNNARLRVQEQANLGESFVTIAENGRNPAFHAKEGGKYGKLFSPGRHSQSTSKLAEYAFSGQTNEETEFQRPASRVFFYPVDQ